MQIVEDLGKYDILFVGKIEDVYCRLCHGNDRCFKENSGELSVQLNIQFAPQGQTHWIFTNGA